MQRGLGVLSLVGALVLASMGQEQRVPAMPSEVYELNAQELSRRSPDYQHLAKDGLISIAALFGQMNSATPEDEDYGRWSLMTFVTELEAMGLERSHLGQGGWIRYLGSLSMGVRIQVDILGPQALPQEDGSRVVGFRLKEALQEYEIVYLNGHSFGGALEELGQSQSYPAQGYGILILDTCWSTQHYALDVLRAATGRRELDLITNQAKSVTGSVQSVLGLLEDLGSGVRAVERQAEGKSWLPIFARMNRSAELRAKQRVAWQPQTELSAPEQYQLASKVASAGS